jgi:hypothetical protein
MALRTMLDLEIAVTAGVHDFEGQGQQNPASDTVVDIVLNGATAY